MKRSQGGYVLGDAAVVGVKVVAGVVATATAAVATAETPEVVERIILGASESALLASIAGSFIGVLVLPNKDTRRMSPPLAGPWWRRARLFALRLGALVAALVGYAFLAAWSVSALGVLMPAFAGAASVPVAGLAGVCVRPILPKFLRALERRTDQFVGGEKL